MAVFDEAGVGPAGVLFLPIEVRGEAVEQGDQHFPPRELPRARQASEHGDVGDEAVAHFSFNWFYFHGFAVLVVSGFQ